MKVNNEINPACCQTVSLHCWLNWCKGLHSHAQNGTNGYFIFFQNWQTLTEACISQFKFCKWNKSYLSIRVVAQERKIVKHYHKACHINDALGQRQPKANVSEAWLFFSLSLRFYFCASENRILKSLPPHSAICHKQLFYHLHNVEKDKWGPIVTAPILLPSSMSLTIFF